MEMPPFNRYLGVEPVRRGEGEVVVRLRLEPHHLNRRGVAHGGVVTSLLDTALGGAVITSIPAEWWCATTSLSTHFVDGAGTGELLASGRVTRRGGRVAFAVGEVRDANGRLIATAQGTWHLWPSRPSDARTLPRGSIAQAGGGRAWRVGKIVAVGRNYAAHKTEMGAATDDPPVMFFKPSTALVGGGGRIALPTGSGSIHHEVELVAVIAKDTRSVDAGAALDHVAGYAVGIDFTLRDLQSEAKRRGEPWSLAKGFDGSAPVSAFVARESVGDGSGLSIELDVGGQRRQHGTTSDMLRPVAELVAWASRLVTLERGDLVFTGTPAGVGPVEPGDRVTARIERVGELVVDLEAPDG